MLELIVHLLILSAASLGLPVGPGSVMSLALSSSLRSAASQRLLTPRSASASALLQFSRLPGTLLPPSSFRPSYVPFLNPLTRRMLAFFSFPPPLSAET